MHVLYFTLCLNGTRQMIPFKQVIHLSSIHLVTFDCIHLSMVVLMFIADIAIVHVLSSCV